MPIIEIAVLIQVGGWLGLWPTLALIILTAVAGTWMLRQQGFAVLARAQQQLERGTVPLAEVFEGFCLVIAGALLLTPGFVTDLMGTALLLPPARAWLYKKLGHHLGPSVGSGMHTGPSGSEPAAGGGQRRPGGQGPVVEGDFETITPKKEGSANDPEPSEPPSYKVPSDRPSGQPMPPPRGSWNDRS